MLGLGWGIASWAEASTIPDPSGPAKEAIEKVWLAHRASWAKGEWQNSLAELEKTYQWKLDQGIRNHYPYSLALVRESQRLASQGDSAAIPELLNYAEKMAPDFSQVPNARAAWLWSQIPQSPGNATKVIIDWYRGVWLSFTNLEESLPQMTNLGLGILLSFFVTFAAFALSLLLRYFSFFAHHVKHLIRLEMSPVLLWVLSLLILFFPFFLGLGWMWLPVLWLLVFWIYGGRADRGVTVVLLALLFLVPTGIRAYSSLLLSLSGNGVPEIVRANTGTWDDELYQKLLTIHRANPQDREVLQALGLVEKRAGKLAEAEQLVLQWMNLEPQPSAALNNLGNIYLVTDRLDQAMEAYQRAIGLDPSRGEAYYNLGQAYLLKLRMKEAEVEFQKAKSIQPLLISYHTSIFSRNPNRLVMDRTIDPARVWRRVLTPSPDRDKLARGLWDILWGRFPLEHGEWAVAGLFVLLGIIQVISRQLSFIRRCDRCGNLVCSGCTRSRVIGTQCVQCLNAFTANPSADLGVVKKKRIEVARYQDHLNSFPLRLSRILPGGGHLVRGHSQEGVVYLFIFILFLTQILLWVGGLPNPTVLNPSFIWPWIFIFSVLFILFYYLVQVRMRRIIVKGGKSNFRRA